MKKKDFLWSLLAVMMAATLSVGLSSCKDPDPTLNVSTDKVEFDARGDGDGDVYITAEHTGWVASVPNGSSWINLSIKEGNGSSPLTISVKEYNTSTKEQEGTVRITSTSGGLMREISVIQKGANAQLSIEKTELQFDAEGGSQSVKISSNSDWTISSDPAWVNVNPGSGSGEKNVTIKVSENTSNDARKCELHITLDDNSMEEILTIEQAKPQNVLSVGSNDINFVCGDEKNFQSDTKMLQIRSNSSWIITGQPSWLGLSSTSGNGDQTITLITRSFNNSSKSRTATLTISTTDGSVSANVVLSQEAGLVAECTVIPTNIITLYNGVAFDYDYGKNAARYFRGYLEKSLVGTMSESEIITVLEERFDRMAVTQGVFTDFSGLDENTAYYIYTLGYNSEGKRGDLTRVEVTTRQRLNNWTLNEPMAWISEIAQDKNYWYWDITKGTRCRTYLEAITENETLAFSSDVCQAWLLDYWRRTNQIYEYENPEPLMATKSGDLLAIFTWGKDNEGVWASCIDWNCAFNSNTFSSIKKAPTEKEKNSGTNDHKLPKKGTLKVRMVKK